MILTKIIDIENYCFSSEDKLFFDANVWIHIFYTGNNPNDRRVRIYSEAFKKALTKGSMIFRDYLVLSEFVNILSRIEYNRRSLETTFKNFRNTSGFPPIASEISGYCKEIIKVTQNNDFSSISQKLDLNKILICFLKQ